MSNEDEEADVGVDDEDPDDDNVKVFVDVQLLINGQKSSIYLFKHILQVKLSFLLLLLMLVV
jgi:hypothetical protein